ncbi:CIC11C00000002537 [Sungouiella intermedia]|uniref:CIC11C00000002537 n=1 Tax=Sungouiella intermedia TaxID=45354 RepID=A0A1L0BWX9_9ASCO|nr:CIC11C00000002537 [[Candida] intermedia]
MTNAGDVLEFCGRVVVFLLEIVLRYSINGISFAHKTFPQATTTILVLLGSYLAYRFIKRVIRIWFNFIISTIKTIFTLLFVGVLFAIYIRGFHRFFTKDIYFIGDMFKLAAQDNFDYKKTGYNYAYKMFDGGHYDFLRRGAKTLFGKEDVTVEEFNNLKDEALEFFAENVDGVKDFLRNNGLNFEVNANQINDFLHNIRF